MGTQAVHQFHSGTAVHDAITNELLGIRHLLIGRGYQSVVFAQYVGQGLAADVAPVADYHGSRSNVLLVHHSHGFDGFNHIADLADRKILIYHNITPSRFLIDDPHGFRYALVGRRLLARYRELVVGAVADSDYNAAELDALGIPVYGVMAPLHGLDRLAHSGEALRIQQRVERVKDPRRPLHVLFVGRWARNKNQHDLIKVASLLRLANIPVVLTLAGKCPDESPYVRAGRALIEDLGVGSCVRVVGDVSDTDLRRLYDESDVYLSLSGHEGFAVPLVEAMQAGLPIVAWGVTGVRSTLGSAGVLLHDKWLPGVAAAVAEFRQTPRLIESVVRTEERRLSELLATRDDVLFTAIDAALGTQEKVREKHLSIQVQGPFETSYSLAEVNRNLALALRSVSDVAPSLYATEGPGDYVPKPADLQRWPGATDLWKLGKATSRPDVVLRNMYPPRVGDASGRVNLLWFAWEETRIHPEWAWAFNVYVDRILVPSTFVADALRESGVTIPIGVIPYGVRQPGPGRPTERLRAALATARRFRFVHISSGFPRKGLDVLFQAYERAFSNEDDVSLIVKTFPNPHNNTEELLRRFHDRPTAPHVIWINEDLDEDELDCLYRSADCGVYPSRGEGFGLPIAETLAAGRPVIVTSVGGHTDFCGSTNAVEIPATLAPAQSHLGVGGACWAEPDADALSDALRRVATGEWHAEPSECMAAVKSLTWERAARGVTDAARTAWRAKGRVLSVGMVSTWNTRCGIAEYTRHLIESSDPTKLDVVVFSERTTELTRGDGPEVVRCWDQVGRGSGTLKDLMDAVSRMPTDVVHVQFNFGFFRLEELARLVPWVKARGQLLCLTLHATGDAMVEGRLRSLKEIQPELSMADRIFVHSPSDEKRLRSFGIPDRCIGLLPHGHIDPLMDAHSIAPPIRSLMPTGRGPIVGTFGFMLPDKGLLELIESMEILLRQAPTAHLLALAAAHDNRSVSQAYEDDCRAVIERLGLQRNVTLVTDFLDAAEVVATLHDADVIVLPYRHSRESASGSVRFAMSAGRPTITSDLGVFTDVSGATLQISAAAPAGDIAAAISHVTTNEDVAGSLAAKARAFAQRYSWNNVARVYGKTLQQLVMDR